MAAVAAHSRCQLAAPGILVETRVGKHWSGRDGDVFTAGARANRPLPAVSGQDSSSRPCATHALSSSDWQKGAPSSSARANTSSAEAPALSPA